jgi:hypothetical protein
MISLYVHTQGYSSYNTTVSCIFHSAKQIFTNILHIFENVLKIYAHFKVHVFVKMAAKFVKQDLWNYWPVNRSASLIL